jgi:hypothetical protein
MKTIKIKSWEQIPENFTGIIKFPGGSKEWLLNGLRHRIGGPAGEYPSSGKSWCQYGKLHRIDGPAIEYADGGVEYWINGKETYKEAVEVYAALFPEEEK